MSTEADTTHSGSPRGLSGHTGELTVGWMRWALVALVALGLCLRLPGYTESVWIDELYTSRLYCGDLIILMKTLFSDTHPPAYFVFIHFWIAVFGDSEVWLRMPPLLCGLMSIVLIARVGTLFGGPVTGLTAAFLLAVSPVHIWYSQEGRPYSTNVFLVLLMLLAFYRLTMGQCGHGVRRFAWRMVFFFALMCGVFTHYYVAVFPLILTALVLARRSENLKSIVASCVIVTALIGGYVGAKMYFSNVPLEMHYLRAFDLQELWLLFFQWFLTGNGFNPVDNTTDLGVAILRVVQAMGVLVAFFGVWRLCRRRTETPQSTGGLSLRAPGIDILLWMLVLPGFLLLLTAIGKDRTYIDRSALPSLPFFILLLSMGLTGFRRRFLTGTALGMAAVTSAIILLAQAVHRANWTVYKPNPDWRAATAFLSSEIDRAQGVLHVYSEVAVPAALTYYDPRIQQSKHFESNDAKISKLIARIGEVFGTEGSAGGMIHTFIRERVDAYQVLLRETRKTTRLWAHYLGEQDPLAESPRRREFWLLIYHGVSEQAQAIIDDPRTEVLVDRAFPSLRLYRLRVKAK